VAAGGVEHPLRHFDRSLRLAQFRSALEHRTAIPDDGLINPHDPAVPRMPRIPDFSGLDPMGV
jgi:hypothetical protein